MMAQQTTPMIATKTSTPAWLDSTDLRLLRRLTRPLREPCLLLRTKLVRRVFGSVEDLHARLSLAGEVLRRRGIKSGLHKGQLPIVDAYLVMGVTKPGPINEQAPLAPPRIVVYAVQTPPAPTAELRETTIKLHDSRETHEIHDSRETHEIHDSRETHEIHDSRETHEIHDSREMQLERRTIESVTGAGQELRDTQAQSTIQASVVPIRGETLSAASAPGIVSQGSPALLPPSTAGERSSTEPSSAAPARVRPANLRGLGAVLSRDAIRETQRFVLSSPSRAEEDRPAHDVRAATVPPATPETPLNAAMSLPGSAYKALTLTASGVLGAHETRLVGRAGELEFPAAAALLPPRSAEGHLHAPPSSEVPARVRPVALALTPLETLAGSVPRGRGESRDPRVSLGPGPGQPTLVRAVRGRPLPHPAEVFAGVTSPHLTGKPGQLSSLPIEQQRGTDQPLSMRDRRRQSDDTPSFTGAPLTLRDRHVSQPTVRPSVPTERPLATVLPPAPIPARPGLTRVRPIEHPTRDAFTVQAPIIHAVASASSGSPSPAATGRSPELAPAASSPSAAVHDREAQLAQPRPQPKPSGAAPKELNLDELADRVQRKIVRQLAEDRIRKGHLR